MDLPILHKRLLMNDDDSCRVTMAHDEWMMNDE